MRNQHPSVCHYCHEQKEPGMCDIWKWHGRWFAACDGCKESNPKQVEAKKRKEARAAEKKSKKAQKSNGTGNREQVLANMSKQDLLNLILSLK